MFGEEMSSVSLSRSRRKCFPSFWNCLRCFWPKCFLIILLILFLGHFFKLETLTGSPSMIGRDQQMNDSFSYVESFVYDSLVNSECWFGRKRVFLKTESLLRIHQWVLHIRKWVIHLLFSANQTRDFDDLIYYVNIFFCGHFYRTLIAITSDNL